MNNVGLAALSAAIGVVAGLATTLLTALVKGRADIDTGLLAKREEAYEKLLALTSGLPAWPPNDHLTYGDLAKIAEQMRDWYFVSGLIMTGKTSHAYRGVQRAIERRRLLAGDESLDRKLSETAPLALITEVDERLTDLAPETHKKVRGDSEAEPRDDYDRMQQLFSRLRTAMTEDLLSRSKPMVLGFRR